MDVLKKNTYYTAEKKVIADEIPCGEHSILEIGCASGKLGQNLKSASKVKRLIGVELFKDAADKASEIYDTIHVGDFEKMELPYRDNFDYILCGDVLEHFRNPDTALLKIKSFLNKSGKVIITIPNVQHKSVIRDLVFHGDWKYDETGGILDATHLRFFTRKSFLRLLCEQGFMPVKTAAIIHGRYQRVVNLLTFRIFEGLFAYQYLFVATPENG